MSFLLLFFSIISFAQNTFRSEDQVYITGEAIIYSGDENFNQHIDKEGIYSTCKLSDATVFIFTNEDNALNLKIQEYSAEKNSLGNDKSKFLKEEKSFYEKITSQEKRRINREIEKIITSSKPSEMKVTFPNNTKNIVYSQSTEKNIATPSHENYCFSEKNYTFLFFVSYYFRDFYQIQKPKFSKDVSNLISGRAPPTYMS